MTGDEIRSLYLDFFKEKGHSVIPSSSLIPYGDPTLLLTTAGMVQFKPYFLGEVVPPNRRLASCQKSFRTTDIESVGDANHLTFFEMLGNFSIGDYFKREAITWAWEFVTERLRLPKDHLWITVFLDDDEAFSIWRGLGVPAERIVRFGEKDNFWGPAGSSGPCGPCSEIHYDFGTDVGCRQPTCALGCRCGRFSEIWNLVFTQFNQDTEGKRMPLPRPNIDTGMGLERITCVMQGKLSVYETDVFAPLINTVAEISGQKYGVDPTTDVTMRTIAEHGRGISFLIADGVMPSNEGRGYVLRRLLRRAMLFGRRLNTDKSFASEVAKVTIEKMGSVYPELKERGKFVLEVIADEEARFRRTLDTGLEMLDGIMEMMKIHGDNEIPGQDAFRLYDTYGFPVEMTQEIAASRGYGVDLKGFEAEMVKQRERARSASHFDVGGAVKVIDRTEQGAVITTTFTGYETCECKARILQFLVENMPVNTIKEGQKASVILDATPFYGERGGQVGDTGKIIGASGEFAVTNTAHVPGDITVQQGAMVRGNLAVGEEVGALVDVERRLDIARNHTATHLLHAALRQVLGEHAQQKGSFVAPDRLRFDFSHLTAVTGEEIEKIEHIVNDYIRRDMSVQTAEMPYGQAVSSGAVALFDEKYGDTVRVVKVSEPPVSAELCGGTHITATGEIGFFHIISESSIGAGLRRIEAVTGRSAEDFVDKQLAALIKVSETLGCAASDVEEKASALTAEMDKERKLRETVEKELFHKIAESLVHKAAVVNGVNILAEYVPGARLEVLRDMSDYLRGALKSAVIVLATVQDDKPAFLSAVTDDLVKKGYNAGNIVKKVAQVTGGSGGGKPNLAQAGGKDKSKIEEALALVKTLV